MKRKFLQTACTIILAFGLGDAPAYAQESGREVVKNHITEVSIYSFKPGIDAQEALEATRSINDFLRSNDGFISRKCAKTADGQWVDIILWASMDKAKAAADQAMKNPVCLAFFEKTEANSSIFLLAEEQFFIQ